MSHLNPYDSPLPDNTVIEQTWNRLMESDEIHVLGLFEGPKLIVTVTCTIIPNLSRSCRPYALIENVVTHRDLRRKGFGLLLIKQTLKKCWEANCYKVMLLSGSKSLATKQFYLACGFNADEKQAFIARPAIQQ